MMATKKIIAICQSGGELVPSKDDGSFYYSGGEAFALDLDQKTELKAFKNELSEAFQCSFGAIGLKYFLPGNRKTLITVSKDKDLKRMVNFLQNADQVEVFVTIDETAALNTSDVPDSRATASVARIPVDIMQTDDAMVLNEQIEIKPLGMGSFSNDEKHCKAATQWKNIITGVDQRFNTFAEFRDALHKYSIAHDFS